MIDRTIGFIGGGRISRIILGGLKRAGQMPHYVTVSDENVETLNALRTDFPNVIIAPNGNVKAAANDLVFLALHPPALKETLGLIATSLPPGAIVVSLAPKLSIAALSAGMGGFKRIVRMNPNAPSIVNAGHNPVAFSTVLTPSEKGELKGIFQLLGNCPEVPEQDIEAFAVLTAMGPTYLWFQLYELVELGKSFGLSADAVESAIADMVRGAVATMFEANLTPAEVMDLVPVKPFSEDEAALKHLYQTKLMAMYTKLRS